VLVFRFDNSNATTRHIEKQEIGLAPPAGGVIVVEAYPGLGNQHVAIARREHFASTLLI
jgi:hypothetical protein